MTINSRQLKNCRVPSCKGAKILSYRQFATLRLCASHTWRIFQNFQLINQRHSIENE